MQDQEQPNYHNSYSIRLVSYILYIVIHLFRFHQKFVHLTLLLDLLTLHICQFKERITEIIDSVELSLNQRDLVSKSSQFHPFVVFKTLQNTRVLRTNISLNNVLNEPYLLYTVLQSMQLRYYLVSLVHQVRPNSLHQIKLSQTIGVSHF